MMAVWVIFALLCGWEGTQWLMSWPVLDPLPFACFSAGAAAAVSAGALLGSGHSAMGRRSAIRLGGFGALALGVPAVLLAVAQRFAAADLALAALAAVPVVVVLTARALPGMEDGAADALLPAIAGLAGALLLVPVGLPASATGWLGLGLDVVAAVCAGVFGVLAHGAARSEPVWSAVGVVAGGNALAVGVMAVVLAVVGGDQLATGGMPGLGAVLAIAMAAIATGVAAGVLLWGMRPLGFAARFLLVPLLASVEGYVMLRPTLSLRDGVGAGLMAVSAVLLLRAVPEGVESVVPRRISAE